jgi:hypothetical protein
MHYRAAAAAAQELGKAGNKDATVLVSDDNSDDTPDGKSGGAYRAVRNFVQKSTVWRALNYSMNYDIHKVSRWHRC